MPHKQLGRLWVDGLAAEREIDNKGKRRNWILGCVAAAVVLPILAVTAYQFLPHKRTDQEKEIAEMQSCNERISEKTEEFYSSVGKFYSGGHPRVPLTVSSPDAEKLYSILGRKHSVLAYHRTGVVADDRVVPFTKKMCDRLGIRYTEQAARFTRSPEQLRSDLEDAKKHTEGLVLCFIGPSQEFYYGKKDGSIDPDSSFEIARVFQEKNPKYPMQVIVFHDEFSATEQKRNEMKAIKKRGWLNGYSLAALSEGDAKTFDTGKGLDLEKGIVIGPGMTNYTSEHIGYEMRQKDLDYKNILGENPKYRVCWPMFGIPPRDPGTQRELEKYCQVRVWGTKDADTALMAERSADISATVVKSIPRSE